MPRHQGSLDRDLAQGAVSGALVAAGLSVPVPPGQNWKVWAITVLVTTTATAGNRIVTAELLDSADSPLAVMAHSQAVTASKTVSVNFGLGGYGQGSAGSSPLETVWDGMPTLVALAGQRFRITDQAGVDITDTAKVLIHAETEPTD